MSSTDFEHEVPWGQDSPSQPTVRVIHVLERLARSPGRSFGATELARLLGLNKSTCLAILSTLTDAGYLIQHPKRRDYRLGPAIVALARSAEAVLPDLDPARPHLRATAEAIGATVNVTSVLEGQLVILDAFGSTNPFGGVLRLGVRVPLIPPYGAVHVAWSDPADRKEWVASAPVIAGEDTDVRLEAALTSARQRGYLVTVDLPAGHELEGIQHRMRGLARRLDSGDFRALARARLSGARYFLDAIDADTRYPVGQIQVPVLTPGRPPELALAANLMGRSVSGTQILDIAKGLMTTAADIAPLLEPPA